MTPGENVELGITAFRAKQRFSGAARLVMVGDGPLHSKSQRQHPGLSFEGLRRGERLAACYASADIFLFPSGTEPCGNVALEAKASGLAVVATITPPLAGTSRAARPACRCRTPTRRFVSWRTGVFGSVSAGRRAPMPRRWTGKTLQTASPHC